MTSADDLLLVIVGSAGSYCWVGTSRLRDCRYRGRGRKAGWGGWRPSPVSWGSRSSAAGSVAVVDSEIGEPEIEVGDGSSDGHPW